MSSSTVKEVRQLRQAIEDQGFRTKDTTKGFFVFPKPGDPRDPVLMHFSPSCPRWRQNSISALKRIGFQPPGNGKSKKGR